MQMKNPETVDLGFKIQVELRYYNLLKQQLTLKFCNLLKNGIL